MAFAYRRIVYYSFLNYLFFQFYWGTHMYMPYYYARAGLSDSRIGFLIGLVSFVTLLVVLPIGALSDRLDPKKLFLAGASVAALFSLLFLAAEPRRIIAPYIFVFGLAVAMLQISLTAHFLKHMEDTGRGNQSAIFAIGSLLGAGIGAQLSGMVVKHFGVENLFWASLGSAALLLVCGLGLPRLKGIPFHLSEYHEDLKHPLSWILLFVAFIVASHSGFEHVGYTLIQTEVMGLSPAKAGELFLYISFWMAAVSWFSGKVHDRAKKPVLYAGLALLISGIFQAASGYGRGFSDFLFIRMMHTVGDSFAGVLMLVVASVVFEKKRAGGSWAILLLVRNLSDFLFANVAGHINQAIGLRRGFLVSGILLVSAGLMVIFILRPRFWKEIRAVEQTGALAEPSGLEF
jgi:sugar phosphate permease